jgi:hypothetical protein
MQDAHRALGVVLAPEQRDQHDHDEEQHNTRRGARSAVARN